MLVDESITVTAVDELRAVTPAARCPASQAGDTVLPIFGQTVGRGMSTIMPAASGAWKGGQGFLKLVGQQVLDNPGEHYPVERTGMNNMRVHVV